jgi:F0F1-type ATP synthase delta subunit
MSNEEEAYKILSTYSSPEKLESLLNSLSLENREKAELVLRIFSLSKEKYN